MRRVSAVDLMLGSTVLLWALNITVTRYIVQNGFQPLAYATIRYLAAIAPLLRRYSPFRVSALVLALGWVPLALTSIPQLRTQSAAGFGGTMWLALAFAVVGPLFLTNILWFTAIDRVGPSRASLFANLEPFFAVLFAVALLDERLNGLELAGGVAIAAGIVIERRGQRGPDKVIVLSE